MTPEPTLRLAWEEFDSVCREFSASPIEVLADKTAELRARLLLKCLPQTHLAPSQVPTFIELVLGRPPDKELLARVKQQRRRLRLAPEEKILLERRQLDRCAVCGTYLNEASSPHVDHIVPIALGGLDEIGNMQLLCSKCNLGKSDLLIWQLGVPFQEDRLTQRLRYCVFARAQGQCQRSGCNRNVRASELQAMPIIPIGLGGRWIFDNLHAVCAAHAQDQAKRTRQRGLAALRRTRQMTTRRRLVR